MIRRPQPILLGAAAVIATALFAQPRIARAAADPALSIIPRPVQMDRLTGEFTLKPTTPIVTEDGPPDAAATAEYLASALNRSTGFSLAAQAAGAALPADAIVLTSQGAPADLGPEGYALEVTPAGVVIRSSGSDGLFYGVQSLLQLLPARIYSDHKVADAPAWEAPAVKIVDHPRFPWRGLMLDVSRHFFPEKDVLRFLDTMASQKLNVFHWHLVDDNGWRIQIMKYPKLTEEGAWRSGIDFGLDPKSSDQYNAKGQYGGFYTQDQIREVVAYARARHIMVVPEIEMPGHSGAALSAYPEFGCQGKPSSVYCAGNDATYGFLEDVLTEVMGLFPSPYIHIGGDEVNRDQWSKCPTCQARMKKEGLTNVAQLQSYFTRRIETFLNAHGRRLIGWDEILDGGLAPNAVVMSWRGIQGGERAAKADHDVVMSPTSNCYLDYYQGPGGIPNAGGGLLTLEKVYSYEPVPTALTPEQAKHVLGVQGNLWTEHMPNMHHVEYMAYPRACAIAEVGWSPGAGMPGSTKDYNEFQTRLPKEYRRLDALGVNYRLAPPAGMAKSIRVTGTAPAMLEITNPLPGAETHYTLDGSQATAQSALYTGPITLPDHQLTFVRAYFARPGSLAGFFTEGMFLHGAPVRLQSSLSQYQDHSLFLALDGSEDTFFWSDREAKAGDHITITFPKPLTDIRSVKVLTGAPGHEADMLHTGVLESSADGKIFVPVADFKAGTAEGALPAGPLAALRIRVTAAQTNWLAVREIELKAGP